MFLAVLAGSCSNDKSNDNAADANSIVGTWDATELKIDDSTASDDAKNGRDALAFLTARDCYVITFTFKEDLSVVAENSVNYIVVNSTGTGLDIPCPTQKDTDNSTYTFDGRVLSIVDGQGMTVSTNVTFDGNTMAIDATGLDIPNFNASGELVFQKR
ncbi:MAG: hypothetical protein WBN39_06760 [Flavobacteriaceae bacterium]